MRVCVSLLAFAVSLLPGCVYENEREGGGVCDPREGEGFTEERVFVAFTEDVAGTNHAHQVVEEEGYSILFFHTRTLPIRATVRVPYGEECAAMARLADHPLVEFTSLEWTVYTVSSR